MIDTSTLNVPVIHAAWCRATSSCPEQWSRANSSRGQCAVTALVVQDAVGGRLLRAVVNGESHYWNLLDDGIELDLTLKQFGDDPTFEDSPEERPREYVLSFMETVERYNLLLRRINDAALITWMCQ